MEEIQETLTEIRRFTLLQAKEMLTIEDVALLTGYKVSTIRKLAQSNRIPYSRPFGKEMFFDKNEINQTLRRNKVPSVEQLTQSRI